MSKCDPNNFEPQKIAQFHGRESKQNSRSNGLALAPLGLLDPPQMYIYSAAQKKLKYESKQIWM